MYQSLVQMIQERHPLDETSEEKAVNLLEHVHLFDRGEADRFILGLVTSSPDEALPDVVASIIVLLSFPNQRIIKATMMFLDSLIQFCSPSVRLKLVRADLLPHIIASLNPLSLSVADYKYIHSRLIFVIDYSLYLSLPDNLENLRIENSTESQAVHETVLKQVLVPSEAYIRHLCVNQYSMIESDQSYELLTLFAELLQICAYYQPIMDFVFKLPVFSAITSAISFCDEELRIWLFLGQTCMHQKEWDKQGRSLRQYGQIVRRYLKMEGFEALIEERLENDKHGDRWELLAGQVIEVSILLGMNLLQLK
ncbi:hypothetical protein BLNAU_16916 [Blattamonas nauphoetae]|uniref:Uncharacterized protein n=1 Tax=Blattamonas nauphoetae TaxID=2049346 RepID=A0ABQ9XCV3_9EUKA|nr:hypothetical protein BLNAU_16916 [Blattamonas nauphoetae]